VSPAGALEGSHRLHRAVSENGAAKLRGTKVDRGLVKRRLATREANGTLRLPDRWGNKRWKQAELDLLGTAPDAELAARFGRTVNAVRVMRNRLERRKPALIEALVAGNHCAAPGPASTTSGNS
jgi:hypothetical protein